MVESSQMCPPYIAGLKWTETMTSRVLYFLDSTWVVSNSVQQVHRWSKLHPSPWSGKRREKCCVLRQIYRTLLRDRVCFAFSARVSLIPELQPKRSSPKILLGYKYHFYFSRAKTLSLSLCNCRNRRWLMATGIGSSRLCSPPPACSNDIALNSVRLLNANFVIVH